MCDVICTLFFVDWEYEITHFLGGIPVVSPKKAVFFSGALSGHALSMKCCEKYQHEGLIFTFHTPCFWRNSSIGIGTIRIPPRDSPQKKAVKIVVDSKTHYCAACWETQNRGINVTRFWVPGSGELFKTDELVWLDISLDIQANTSWGERCLRYVFGGPHILSGGVWMFRVFIYWYMNIGSNIFRYICSIFIYEFICPWTHECLCLVLDQPVGIYPKWIIWVGRNGNGQALFR